MYTEWFPIYCTICENVKTKKAQLKVDKIIIIIFDTSDKKEISIGTRYLCYAIVKTHATKHHHQSTVDIANTGSIVLYEQ